VTGAAILLAFVTLERLGELILAQRNTDALLARGGQEFGQEHYRWIVLLHAAWLTGLWIFGWSRPVSAVGLIAFLGLQLLRAWVLTTLGRRWTTRIIVVPGESLVNSGPYKWISHPNYVVVCGEIAVLPLALALPLYALIFSLANAAVLMIRIRTENSVLAGLRHAPPS
jgi:methyltransferase